MTAALAALPFLATLWLLMVVGAMVLEESGGKIAAGLKGKPRPSVVTPARSLRIRMRQPLQPSCAEARWRAAA
jgi:hypothetical protein